jgi:hypothetical protein
MSGKSPLAALERIAEQRIREALERGELDNLPGSGKPIDLEDDRHLPEDLRLAYKILKNADCLPPELELKKEISNTEALLGSLPDEGEKYKQLKKLNYMVMKLNEMRKGSVRWEEKQRYYEKIVNSIGSKKHAEGTE